MPGGCPPREVGRQEEPALMESQDGWGGRRVKRRDSLREAEEDQWKNQNDLSY